MPLYEYATFGNRDGSHQLIETTLVGEESKSLIDELRFLVDRPAGQIGPEVVWTPYWGCGPVRDWWVVWRGDEDRTAPRRNMVRGRAALIRQRDIGLVDDISEICRYLSIDPSVRSVSLGGVVRALSSSEGPVIVPDISVAPAIIATLWPRLWPAVRRRFALRTFFGSESLESADGPGPHIVVVPAELRPRWLMFDLVETRGQEGAENESGIPGGGGIEVERLLRENWNRLPGDFNVLTRMKRITNTYSVLADSPGKFADALLVARTVESFADGLVLPGADRKTLIDHLSDLRHATAVDLRTASLVNLSWVGRDLDKVRVAVARWIEERLPAESDRDAVWILEHQCGAGHATWWLEAVRTGLRNALTSLTSQWADALWRWWKLNPEAVAWTSAMLPLDPTTETALLKHLPREVDESLQAHVRSLSAQRQWARLLAGLIRPVYPLGESVALLRKLMANPEPGLDVLLETSSPSETVKVAVDSGWHPLVMRAAQHTSHDTALFEGVSLEAPGFLPLLLNHIRAGGTVPQVAHNHVFLYHLFDRCLAGENDCIDVIPHLGPASAQAVLVYARQDELLRYLGPERGSALAEAAGAAWLQALMDERNSPHPGSILSRTVRRLAPTTLVDGSARRVIDFLLVFPDMPEKSAADWLMTGRFSWKATDEEKLGEILVARRWKHATKRFAESRISPLKTAAWHARELLSVWDRVLFVPPETKNDITITVDRVSSKRREHKVKVVFLAANPSTTDWIGLDQEARAIEEKVRASKFRDAIEVRSKWAVRPGDLHQILLEEQPTVVHFSGHGAGAPGIVLHSEREGEDRLVSSEALAHLFRVLRDNIRVVVLNACYSKEQADCIVKEIDFVVAMADSISDEAAREFAAAFYGGLGFGRSVQTAFDLGISALKLLNIKGTEIPVLLTREGVNAASATLVSSAME